VILNPGGSVLRQVIMLIYCNVYANSLLPPAEAVTPNQAINRRGPHILLRVSAGHLLLHFLLQLLAGADGFLVAGEVGQLLQPGVGEVLGEMLAAPLVGRKELLGEEEEAFSDSSWYSVI